MKKIAGFFSFSGRARRAKFLQTVVISILVWLLARYIDDEYLAPNLCLINENWTCYFPNEFREGITFAKVVGALLVIPVVAVMVRRLHDHGKPGWWILIAFTIIGLVPLLYWMLTKGDPEENRYG